ncbi:MAG: F-box protein [Candidatus Rhabdochlamydia sp.]
MIPILIHEMKFNAFCHIQAKRELLLVIKCVRVFFSYPISNSNSTLFVLKNRCSKLIEFFVSTTKAILLCLPLINKYVSFSNYLEFNDYLKFEKQQSYSPISSLPDEILLKIFGDLSPKDLCQATCVSKHWNQLASDKLIWQAFDLKKIFPSLKVIDQAVWQAHYKFAMLDLSIDDSPSFDKRVIILALQRLFTSLQIEGEAGITLLTLPKGLTIHKLKTLLNCMTDCYYEPDFMEEFKHVSVDRTYTIAITNAILKGSERLPTIRQQDFIKEKGCEMPTMLEAATFFAFLDHKPHPLNQGLDLPLCTHCREQIKGDNLIVGPSNLIYFANEPLFYMGLHINGTSVTTRGCFIKKRQPFRGSQYDVGLMSNIGSFGVLKV